MEELKQSEEAENQGEDAVAVSVRYIAYICLNILMIATVLFGTFKLCSLSYHSCYEIFGSVSPEKSPGQNKDFEINVSDDLFAVSSRLEQNGLIANKYTFMARVKLLNAEKMVLHPGKYTLNTSMDYENVIDRLTSGR